MRKTWIACLVLGVAACGGGADPADPTEARQSVRALVPGLVADTGDAFDDADGTDALMGFRGSMSELNYSFAGLPFEFPFGDSGATLKRPQAEEPPGEEMARWLEEHIFTDDAYEGDGVYRIRGAAICPVADGATAPDPDCVKNVDDAQLRLRVTRAGGGLDITLLVGQEQAEPVTLRLRQESIDVEVDLAEAKAALRQLAKVADVDLNFPATMEGSVAATLVRRGARHVELSAAVRRAVTVAGLATEGPYSFTAAARDPLIKLVLDGTSRRHTLDIDVGAVALTAPWKLINPDSNATGKFAFALRALTAKVALDAAAHLLTVNDVSLGDGPLSMDLDSHRLLAIDLNANGGRKLSLQVVPKAGEYPRFVFNPDVDLSIALGFAPLAAAGDDVETWARDEVFTIHVGQEVQPLSGAVKAVKGMIRVAAVKAGASVTATEGQCLFGDTVTAGEHPVIGLLRSGPCL